MLPFRILRPRSALEVMALLDEYRGGARLLLGGTDLTVGLRHGIITAETVIDLKRVQDLPSGIEATDGVLRVGANVLMADLVSHPLVGKHFPALVEAASVVGSPQIRNRATLVGNICNASPAADTVPVLVVYGAEVHILGPGGTRAVPVVDFIVGNRKLDLGTDEFVDCVRLPLPDAPFGAAFDRITRRRGVDLATVNMCCGIGPDGKAKLAIGAASPRPLLIPDQDGIFSDETAGPADREAALEALVSQAAPISDVRASAEYRRFMLKVLGRRTQRKARERYDALAG